MLKLQIPMNSEGDVFEFKLKKGKVTIGRRHDNDIRIKEDYVSAYHAELCQEGDGHLFLVDRDSSNGTYLNGMRVNSKRVKVSKGDILKFGKLVCSIEEVIEQLREAPLDSKVIIEKSEKEGFAGDLAKAVQKDTSAVSSRTTLINPYAKGRSPSGKNGIPAPSPSPVTEKVGLGPGSKNESRDFAVLAEELRLLKSQFALNKQELGKAKGDLKSISSELTKAKEKAAQKDQSQLKKIADLEMRLEEKETSYDEIDHRLNLANGRADRLESELEYRKTDMSAEIKAAMQRLSSTKNDNVLLQGTLGALEEERNRYRDDSLALSKKLSKTREGFSFFLQNSAKKLSESNLCRGELEKDQEKSKARLSDLEEELDSLREDFQEMEETYRQKLKDAEKKQNCSNINEQSLVKDLDAASEELKSQKETIRRLENTLQVVEVEKEAAEEDWKARVFELQETNEKLGIYSSDLNILETKVKEESELVAALKAEKTLLEENNKNLRAKKDNLADEAERIESEKDKGAAVIKKVGNESRKASQKLEAILRTLHESEKKVSYLRSLESELEKSVLRAQRSALSRKGIYREDGESDSTIWPEAEQLICRELIDRLELLEDLLSRYQQNWFFPKVAEQLNQLRDSFVVLLKNHSVDRFDLEPGTELSIDSRKKIQLISVDDLEDPKLKRLSAQHGTDKTRTKVLQTVRPGYIYSNGGEDIIIRKAEVVVA